MANFDINQIVKRIQDTILKTLSPQNFSVDPSFIEPVARKTAGTVFVEVANRFNESLNRELTLKLNEVTKNLPEDLARSVRSRVTQGARARVPARRFTDVARKAQDAVQRAIVNDLLQIEKYAGEERVKAIEDAIEYSMELQPGVLGFAFGSPIRVTPTSGDIQARFRIPEQLQRQFAPLMTLQKPEESVPFLRQQSSYYQAFANTYKNVLMKATRESLFKILPERSLGARQEDIKANVNYIMSQIASSLDDVVVNLIEFYRRGYIKNLDKFIASDLFSILGQEVTLTSGQRVRLPLMDLGEDVARQIQQITEQLENLIIGGQVSKTAIAQGLRPEEPGAIATPRAERLKALFSKQQYAPIAKKLFELDPGLFNLPDEMIRRVDIEKIYGGAVRARIRSIDDTTGAIKTVTIAMDKYGNVIADTSSRFRSFVDGVRRDVKEFAKWSLAISAVYLPMQLLNESVSIAIRQQTQLANVLITLNKSQEYSNRAFQDAYKIAKETGQSISGVLDGYNLALRATGDLANSYERVATANQLMKDSLVLAGLANISQAESTDILVAALKQTGLGLDEGTKLLNKWTRVSKVSNVDINTLATSFAIVGEAAKQAGLSVDDLNALIATVAATGITSAKETGNAVRAIISGVTSERTAEELRKYGIAVRDTSGKLRDFKSIVQDIKESFAGGLISPDQLNKLAYVIGGGNRRQAQVVATMVQWDEVARISNESARAGEEAWEAYRKKLETTQVDIVQLQNAFESFARSMFTNGGILDGLSALLKLLTGVTEAVGGLVGVVGTAAPALSALGIGNLLIGRERFATFIGNASERVIRGGLFSLASSRLLGQPTREYLVSQAFNAENIANKLAQKADLIGALMASGLMAALDFAKTGKLENAGLIMGGAVAGALLSKGHPIGVLIGSTIAETFINQVEKTRQEIAAAEVPEDIRKRAGSPIEIALMKSALDISSWVNKNILGRNVPQLPTEMVTWMMASSNANLTVPQRILEGIPLLGNLLKLRRVLQPSQSELDKIIQESYGTAGLTKYGVSPTITTSIPREVVQRARESQIRELEKGFYTVSPTMSLREFSEAKQNLTGLDSFVQRLASSLTDLGKSFDAVGASDWESLSEISAQLLAFGDKERLDEINAILTEYLSIADKLKAPTAKTKGITVFDQFTEENINISYDEAKNRLQTLGNDLINLVSSTSRQIQANLAKLPSFNIMSDMTKRDVELAAEYASRYAEEILSMLTNAQKEAFTQMAADQEMWIKTSEGQIVKLKGFQAMLFREGASLAEVSGAITNVGVPIEKTKYTEEEITRAIQMARAVIPELTAMGYKSKEEPFIMRLEGGQFKRFVGDQTLVKMFLEEIAGNTEKQLEGIYNLPSGAEFFVPYQAAIMAMGTSITSSVNNVADRVSEVKSVEEQQVSAIDNLSDTMSNLYSTYIDRWSTTRYGTPEEGKNTGADLRRMPDRYMEENRATNAWAERYKGLAKYYGRDIMELYDLDTYKNMLEYWKKQSSLNLGASVPSASQPVAQQNLRLNVTSNITLVVDGKPIAQLIAQRFLSQLMRYSATQSTITKSVMV